MSVVINHWQVAAALTGLAGTGLFALSSVLPWRSCSGTPARVFFRLCLLMGLLAWIILAWLRHDVVACTGLLVAMLLVLRHALASRARARKAMPRR